MSDRSTLLPTKQVQSELNKLLSMDENTHCSDCGAFQPKWASILVQPPDGEERMGLFCCLLCSGVHRSLGTHITRVKSIDLDEWTQPEIDAMKRGGNLRINTIYEGGTVGNKNLASSHSVSKPTQKDDDRVKRESFIKDKYVGLEYVLPGAYSNRSSRDESNKSSSSSTSRGRLDEILDGFCKRSSLYRNTNDIKFDTDFDDNYEIADGEQPSTSCESVDTLRTTNGVNVETISISRRGRRRSGHRRESTSISRRKNSQQQSSLRTSSSSPRNNPTTDLSKDEDSCCTRRGSYEKKFSPRKSSPRRERLSSRRILLSPRRGRRKEGNDGSSSIRPTTLTNSQTLISLVSVKKNLSKGDDESEALRKLLEIKSKKNKLLSSKQDRSTAKKQSSIVLKW